MSKVRTKTTYYLRTKTRFTFNRITNIYYKEIIIKQHKMLRIHIYF